MGITHGDTNGIGYELIFKTFADAEMLGLCTPIVYGSPKVATYHRNALGIEANFSIINSADQAEDNRVNMLAVFEDEVKVEFGVTSEEASRAAVKALDKAITDYKNGDIDVIVSCPVNENNLTVEGYAIPKPAKYIETSIGEGKKVLDIVMNEWLKVALMTDDMALKDVPTNISAQAIIEKIAIFYATLRRDMRISAHA